jgi:hypothetical protein
MQTFYRKFAQYDAMGENISSEKRDHGKKCNMMQCFAKISLEKLHKYGV